MPRYPTTFKIFSLHLHPYFLNVQQQRFQRVAHILIQLPEPLLHTNAISTEHLVNWPMRHYTHWMIYGISQISFSETM